MKQQIINILLFTLIIGLGIYVYLDHDTGEQSIAEIRLEQPEFLLGEPNAENMLLACKHYGVKYPEIVTAQAILESGNFKSRVFREYNNPFGLYNSREKDYFKFDHWSDAILAYRTKIEYKYGEGDYYEFLKYLPYAEDKEYISKVKSIESNLPP